MKKSLLILIALIFTVSGTNAQQMSDKEKLVKAAQLLEEQPLHKDAKDIRAWAVVYVSETNDVTVVLCGGPVMEPIMSKKNKFSNEMLGQYMMAMAAFKFSNPENKNENDAQYAGILSALKAYENMLKEKPKNKNEAVDAAITKRDNGELRKMVDQADCGKK